MLLSTATDQAHQDRPCGLPATDIRAEIGHIAPAERTDLVAASAHFPELAAFIEGCHHAADRGRSTCLCSDACPDIHASGRPLCGLLCRPDRPEPSARRALRQIFSACARRGHPEERDKRYGNRKAISMRSAESCARDRCPWLVSTPPATKSSLTRSVRSSATDNIPERRPGRPKVLRRSAGFGLLSFDGFGAIGRWSICRLHMGAPFPCHPLSAPTLCEGRFAKGDDGRR